MVGLEGKNNMSDALAFPSLNIFLAIGGTLSFLAGILHLACIVGGPDWLRFFGAGEALARMAEKGHWYPAFVTGVIALVLFGMSTYAFVGAVQSDAAGVPMALPLLKWGLIAITAVYMLRGALPFVVGMAKPVILTPFTIWSSAIVLVFGLVHLVGLVQVWARL